MSNKLSQTQIADRVNIRPSTIKYYTQLNTGKKVSTSAVIRTSIEKYLKTGKL